MKRIAQPIVLSAAAAILLFTAGCQSVSTTAVQDLGAPQFAKVDPSQVQILRTEPTRPHVRLGEVRAETASPETPVPDIEQALKKKGASIGADALVVIHDSTQVTGAQVVGSWRNRSVIETEGRVIITVAIKYK